MAKLQRALIAYFLDEANKAGYAEYQVPHLVNEDSARGQVNFQIKRLRCMKLTLDGLYLIPTAEVPLTNLYRDALIHENDLPIKAHRLYAMFPKGGRFIWQGGSRA